MSAHRANWCVAQSYNLSEKKTGTKMIVTKFVYRQRLRSRDYTFELMCLKYVYTDKMRVESPCPYA